MLCSSLLVIGVGNEVRGSNASQSGGRSYACVRNGSTRNASAAKVPTRRAGQQTPLLISAAFTRRRRWYTIAQVSNWPERSWYSRGEIVVIERLAMRGAPAGAMKQRNFYLLAVSGVFLA